MFFAVLTIVLLNISCQQKKDNTNYKGMYEVLMGSQKYDELYKHLQEWEKNDPYNPEMFIAFFNYYTFRDGPNENIADFLRAVEYLDKGLSISPKRLDMRFGKIHALNKIEFYKEAGNELYATLELSPKIDNNWLWADNIKLENGEEAFLKTIDNYYDLWLNVQTEESLGLVKQCAEKQIELYPRNTSPYNNLAIYYSVKAQPQESLKYLLQAETIDPGNCTVLINIARIYSDMDDKEKAKEYFELVQRVGNEQERALAEYSLSQL
jgi:hypothetical protein